MSSLLNLNEIKEAATWVINKKAWAYYYSAACLVLSDEMKICMRLPGAETVEDLGPHLVR
jgi:hypothetical protein